MDIRSKLPYPAGDLTNFAPYFFYLDGVLCASMEGFLQSLLTDDLALQAAVCMLVGIEAKQFGLERIEAWKQGNHELNWRGKKYDRHGQEYQELLDRAYAALFLQNESFRKALWDTGAEVLTHSIGVADPNEDILTEEEFCFRLMQLRCSIVLMHQCGCPCHDEGVTMMHFVACCCTCKLCGGNIRSEMAQEHMRVCHGAA